ncbi:helix-turn-helix domain-containing protein [Phenylobacterium sp.]|uniref:MarR family winged helix-turn-helix transcriptional regulator n=1 Tax=Phenylobacterium sp. TaxID=1871053 RepID=UPI002DED75EA|nr:helix-turn-helix domain-containing protein [Phenylobacterium sp.]
MKRASVPVPTPPRRARLSAADYQAVGAFRLALRRFAAFGDASAQAAGLTPQQHQALLAIRAHPGPQPMTIGELAQCLLIRNHSAVELVARLVAAQLVTRAPSGADRRRILLRLTPDGENRLEAVTRQNLRELRSTAPIFRDLLKTLRRIGRETDD